MESLKLINEVAEPEYRQKYFVAIDFKTGTTMLHGNGASSVRICDKLINQLFPLPNPPTS